MRNTHHAGFQKLSRRWEKHRRSCPRCRAAINGKRKLRVPCNVERFLYELAERARVRKLVRAATSEAS